jgi:hypothetical protein
MECREFADRSQQVIAERSRSMKRKAREHAAEAHVGGPDDISPESGQISNGDEAEDRTTSFNEPELDREFRLNTVGGTGTDLLQPIASQLPTPVIRLYKKRLRQVKLICFSNWLAVPRKNSPTLCLRR